MWLYRLKHLLAEREVLIGLGIFGIVVMAADLLNDLKYPFYAALIRGVGLFSLLFLLAWEFWLRSRFRQQLPVPVMFTEETDRSKARSQFDRFVQSANLGGAVKVLESVSPLRRHDLLVGLDRESPRSSVRNSVWRSAWRQLLRDWEHEIDKRLIAGVLANEERCYHILPQIVLPLSFSIGASVNLRRSLIIYHYEQERIYPVLNLTEPRSLFQEPDSSVPPPQSQPDDLTSLPEADKLILHLVISDRHPAHLDKHPDHSNAANAAFAYHLALDPKRDWLPYVQWFAKKASPLVARYQQVEVCLICPSAVAFALGMAFSRTPRITVCHWFGERYQPVMSLEEIEKRLPFD